MSKDKPEFEVQEVEVSEVSDVQPDSPKESEITEVEEETQLEEYEKALNKSVTKAQIAKGKLHANYNNLVLKQEDEQEQKLGTDKADEFVRNFFIKYEMKRTIDAFQVWRLFI